MAKAAKKKQPGEEKLKDKQQEMFCWFYAGVSTRDFFGNASASYTYAYSYQNELDDLEEEMDGLSILVEHRPRRLEVAKRITQIKNTCKTNGSRLLTKANVLARVDFLFDRYIEDDKMDREMAFVIGQRYDLMSKVNAYTAVAKIRERIKDKLTGELVVRWEDDSDDTEVKKDSKEAKKQPKKPVIKATINLKKESEIAKPTADDDGFSWEEDDED